MHCNIYDIPLFRGGNREIIENVLKRFPGRYSEYEKDDIIAMQGYSCRSLYILCEGSVYARMVSEEGKEFTLDTLSAPEVLASAFVFSSDSIFPVTIFASGKCGIWILGKDCIWDIIRQDSTVLGN